MRLTRSSRRGIPLVVQQGFEYYPWQILSLLKRWSTSRHISKSGLRFTKQRWRIIGLEWESWKRCYAPSDFILKNSLILDAGAGEGETALFYYLAGFRRFRCVESDPRAFMILARNAQCLGDAEFDLRNHPFVAEDTVKVDFAKIDVEGGEIELLKVEPRLLPQEIAVETHGTDVQRALRRHLLGMRLLGHMPWNKPDTLMWRWKNRTA
jgi:SAM-dependent methyltransferase